MLERYHRDPLADFSDEDIARLHTEEPAANPELSSTPDIESFHPKYLYDQYEWREFKTDCAVVRLTKGYFTFVEHEDLKKMEILDSIWTVISLDPRGGEIIKVRAWCQFGWSGRRIKMSLHRFLTDAKEHDFIDHYNRHTLDNRRRRNLFKTNQATNLAQARHKSERGLLRGVMKWGLKFKGRIKYKGETEFSESAFDTQAEAHAWYLARHAQLYGYVTPDGRERIRDYPVFPPLKKPLKIDLPDFAVPVPTGEAVHDILATF